MRLRRSFSAPISCKYFRVRGFGQLRESKRVSTRTRMKRAGFSVHAKRWATKVVFQPGEAGLSPQELRGKKRENKDNEHGRNFRSRDKPRLVSPARGFEHLLVFQVTKPGATPQRVSCRNG